MCAHLVQHPSISSFKIVCLKSQSTSQTGGVNSYCTSHFRMITCISVNKQNEDVLT